jgi:hypothetical protein
MIRMRTRSEQTEFLNTRLTSLRTACPPIPDWDKGHRGVEDVLVDTRGYRYMTNGAEGGIWIVRYTGSAPN